MQDLKQNQGGFATVRANGLAGIFRIFLFSGIGILRDIFIERSEEKARLGDFVFALVVAEQAVVTNFDKARWEDVKEETTDELLEA